MFVTDATEEIEVFDADEERLSTAMPSSRSRPGISANMTHFL